MNTLSDDQLIKLNELLDKYRHETIIPDPLGLIQSYEAVKEYITYLININNMDHTNNISTSKYAVSMPNDKNSIERKIIDKKETIEYKNEEFIIYIFKNLSEKNIKIRLVTLSNESGQVLTDGDITVNQFEKLKELISSINSEDFSSHSNPS